MPRPGISHDAFIQPFPTDIKVSPDTALPTQRSRCPECNRSCMWFCADCKRPMGDGVGVPSVTLPISVHIIHHPTEKLTKSTSPHAAILSPQVTIIDYPNVPEYDKSKTLLLYPSEEAVSIDRVNLTDYNQVVFVDSTWSQAGGILLHPNFAGLQHVKLEQQHTSFWRVQRVGSDHLATIEAVYYFFRQHHTAIHGKYSHEFDDLLFYFAHQHSRYIKSQKEKVEEYMRSDECQAHLADLHRRTPGFDAEKVANRQRELAHGEGPPRKRKNLGKKAATKRASEAEEERELAHEAENKPLDTTEQKQNTQ